MSHNILKTVLLVDTNCAACGIEFAMPDWLEQRRRHDGQSFYCPQGHTLYFRASENEQLRKKIARLESRTVHLEDQRQAAERSAAAYKGKVTQLRKRVSNGVCPCCNRTFANVARHMTTKHPDYTESGSGSHDISGSYRSEE